MPALRLFDPGDDDGILAGSPPPARFENATVQAVLDWFAQNNPKPSRSKISAHEIARVWRLFGARYGHLLCTACKPHMLLEFIAAQPRVRSNWSRKRWSVTVQRPFNTAAKLQLIPYNPFKGVSYPSGPEGRDWRESEYLAMMRATTPEFRRVLVFLRFSGLRPGELRGLIWDNIRDEIKAIIIDPENVKTGVKRKIPFNIVLIKLLLWLRRRSTSQYVFVNSFGGCWKINAICKRLRELREKLGLSDKVKLHGGRHFFGTHAIMNNTDLATLAELMGHRDVATTKKYVHLADKVEHLAEAMAKAVRSKR